MTNKLCIYHANCSDGFTAAWVVRRALGDDVEFYPGIYQQVPPDVTGKDVYIVDFSYKRNVMEDIISKANSVTHIDHHHSAIVDLAGLENSMSTLYSLENAYSGAMLTWMYFYPDKECPQLIKHVDDRDRWQFKLPGTKEIQASVSSYEFTFENWDYLMSADINLLAVNGASLERKSLKDINELISALSFRMVIAGYDVPVCNLPYMMSSEAGHIMGAGEPFAACFYYKPNGVEFSLRSDDNGVDVSAIAMQFGGGGHCHASGFRIDYETAMKMFETRHA